MFCGRTDDLRVLENGWSATTQLGGYPQIVVVLGDSGMGKTRLAQEFYARLTETRDPTHYWPGALGQNGRNLNVNPALSDCGAGEPAFLWWGLRFSDSASRNAVAPSPLDADLPILATHLAQLTRSIRDNERRTALQFLLSDFAVDVGIELATHTADLIPGFAAAKAAVKTGQRIARLRREHLADRPNLTLSELAERESREKGRRLAEIFTAIMEAKGGSLPICLLLDDGHFSEANSDAIDLIKNLLAIARKNCWPFMLIVTFWPKEWNEKKSPLAKWLGSQAGNIKLHTLGKIDDLSPVLKNALPGLTAPQVKKIIERVDGNPEFLGDIIGWLRIEIGNFAARDPSKALTAKGLDRVMKFTQDRHKFTKQRIVNAGEPIRQVLALGSSQGMRFMTDVVVEMSSELELTADNDAVHKAEIPHAFIVRDDSLAEFSQRLYLEVAAADLQNFADEERVRALLVDTLISRLNDQERLASLRPKDRRATLRLAANLLQDESDPIVSAHARKAGIALIDELYQSAEFQAAGSIAAEMIDRWMKNVL
jgi:hypothetical protein